ncbi:MAG TPA: hypothetical protein VHY91_00145 [Pirellulales bacterium]|jgi:hypothetical protein|nr:hypothetical protein [Pirellulales bacterium]
MFIESRSCSRRPSLLAALFFAAVALPFAAVPSAAAPPDTTPENALFHELTTVGVPLGSDARAPLPAPLLADGLDSAGQKRALAELADDTHPLDTLLRKSVVAPFKLKISDVAVAGTTGTGRRVDLWFVVYADLDRIADADVLQHGFEAETKSDGGGSAPKVVALSEAELTQRGITPATDERWFAGSMNLFDRVELAVTLAGEQTRTPESVLVAMRIDPRFDDDRAFPNRWLPLVRDESGAQKPGQPHTYHAAGGYLKATRLVEPAGALLVEYHLAFDEPAGWFSGANLLRSKLPIVCQDGVRKFRRRFASH